MADWSHETPCKDCENPKDLSKDLREIDAGVWQYRVLKMIGKGGFGRVYLAERLNDNIEVAMKFLYGDYSRKAYAKELDLTKMVTRVPEEYLSYFPELLDFFIQNHYKSLVVDLMPTALNAYMDDNDSKGIPLVTIQNILMRLFHALIALKGEGIVHADIKPHNIMVYPDKHKTLFPLKLIDFGCSGYGKIHTAGPGTISYNSPESLFFLAKSYPSDIFSTALTSLNTFIGVDLCPVGIRKVMMSTYDHYIGPIPDFLIKKAVGLGILRRCFSKVYEGGAEVWKFVKFEDRKEKIHEKWFPRFESFDKIKYHEKRTDFSKSSMEKEMPAIEAYLDLIQQMIRYIPEERITAEDALNSTFMQWHFPEVEN